MSPTGPPIGVGIIGLSTSGWASQAHVGGLAPLKGKIELKALSTRSAESAEAAGQAHGVKAYHGDPSQIANDPNVDLVVVAVNVGGHRDAVWPAIEAGKDVFVEWPLGVDYQEAREIADFAEQKGVRTMVGLQARQSPAVKKVKELVDNGSIGRVLSSSLVGRLADMHLTTLALTAPNDLSM
jgi:predicted dehydrogenase